MALVDGRESLSENSTQYFELSYGGSSIMSVMMSSMSSPRDRIVSASDKIAAVIAQQRFVNFWCQAFSNVSETITKTVDMAGSHAKCTFRIPPS